MREIQFYSVDGYLSIMQSQDIGVKGKRLSLNSTTTTFYLGKLYSEGKDRTKFEFWNPAFDELCASVIWDNKLNRIHKLKILDPDFKLVTGKTSQSRLYMEASFEHIDLNLRVYMRKPNRSWAYIHRIDLTSIGSAVPKGFKEL